MVIFCSTILFLRCSGAHTSPLSFKTGTIDTPFEVVTMFVSVTIYIFLISRSVHFWYWGVCSSSSWSNSSVVISLISFAIVLLLYFFLLNIKNLI